MKLVIQNSSVGMFLWMAMQVSQVIVILLRGNLRQAGAKTGVLSGFHIPSLG